MEEAVATLENLVITPEEIAAYNKTSEPVKDAEKPPEAPPAETVIEKPKFKLGDAEYEESEILKWKTDSENKKKWSKENTDRSEEVAAKRRLVEPVIKMVERLKGNGTIVQDIKDLCVTEFGQEFAEVIDEAIKFDAATFKHPDTEALELVNAEKEEIRLAGELKQAFMREHSVDEKVADEVYEFASERFKEGYTISLEDAFEIIQSKKAAEERDRLAKENAELKKKPAKPPDPPDLMRKDQRGVSAIEKKPATKLEDLDTKAILAEYAGKT